MSRAQRLARPASRRARPPVYVLPTRFGAAFALLSLLTLVGCINYLLSLGYALTFLLLSIWIVGAVHASRSLTGVSLRLTPPERAFVGERAAFVASLSCDDERPRPPVGVRAGGQLVWLDLSGGGQVQGALPLPAPRRGPFALPDLRLEGHDPLGLWRSMLYPARPELEEGAGLIVFPAPEEGAPPPGAARHQAGEGGSGRVAGDQEFLGLRDYRPGDPLPRVAWKQSARRGSLLSAQFDAPAAEELRLAWEDTRSLAGTEGRLSRLTAWVLAAGRQGRPFSLALPGARLGPGSGEGHLGAALRALALHDLPVSPPARPRGRWPFPRDVWPPGPWRGKWE